MFGIKYIRFDSNTYVIHYKNGKVKSEGRGLSFFYFAPSSSIVAIPMGSADAPFIFQETTGDFQTVTVQGQITYKIDQAKQLAEFLDFSVNAKGQYISDDYEKLSQRLVNEAQTAVKAHIQKMSIKAAIKDESLSQRLMDGLGNSEAVNMLGIKPLSVHVLSVKPNPEMARALEAETREALQQDADEAIYTRRNFAVEQERKIKESELSTEIAVEEKKKQIAEKKMETEIAKAENQRKLREMNIAADITIGEQRKQLVAIEAENTRKKADAEAYKLEKTLTQYKDLDWKILTAMNGGGTNSHIAAAFHEIAQNASNIGTLNITPDLLQSLTNNS